MKTAIVWFKTDLRLYDNEALVKQSHKAKKVLPVCFDDADFVTTRYGLKKRVIIEPNFIRVVTRFRC
jgi:deoxyribodipyrimidine photo-lyase